MKKIFKILLVTTLALTLVLGIVACSDKQNGGTPGETIGTLDVDAGEYTETIGTAYGAEPDLDNVIIDGLLDDELWQDKSWYTQYEPTQRIKIMVTSAMSEKGFYIAANSNDQFIYWNGYNYFFKNTHFYFQFYSGNNAAIRVDAVSVQVNEKYINARSRVLGEYNAPGRGGGLNVEVFIPWHELGIDTTNGLPETVKMYPIYNFCLSQNAVTNALYPTFVKTMGDSGQVTLFGKDGYVNGDAEGAIVGSHQNGQARTNGWTVENPGQTTETATSDMNATYNFAQAIFFRNLTSSIFRVSTKMKIIAADDDSRAGILLYKDNINYRAAALNITPDNFSNGKMSSYALKGYTNYPYNITAITDLIEIQADTPTDTVELTVYSKTGKLYYLINGVYAYSEDATYVATNAYAGFYAFNATVEFFDYDYEVYNSEAAFDEALAEYAYTIDIVNPANGYVNITTNQLAVPHEGDSNLQITMTFRPGYTLDEFYYITQSGQNVDIKGEAEKATGGVFTLHDVRENIELHATGKQNENSLIDLKLNVVNSQTHEKVRVANIVLYGSGPYSRYDQQYNSNVDFVIRVEKDNVWNYILTANGYRDTNGIMFDGEPLTESMTDPVDVVITNTVVGGTAESVLDENGNPVVSFNAASTPGTKWDLSYEDEGRVIFQTPDNDKGVIYFSGRTISDFQVAYVEITNRTDPASFTSFENDPAAGFIITTAGNESFMGLRKTGLRLKRERNNWTAGTYTDTSGVCNWEGYLGNTDRENGGRFINAYEGTGTVDRIPYNGQEYTNSFLMIRKGPNYYFYAADGSAGVLPDFTNFDKLKEVGSFYNDLTPGYAAIGLTCTVAYNLRMDFENYWILVGDEAEEFAGKLIATPFEIENGGSKVELDSTALVGYKSGEDQMECGIVTGGSITVRPSSWNDNKILKVSFSDGTNRYLTSLRDSFTYAPKAVNGSVKMSVSEVDFVEIGGHISVPSGLAMQQFNGEIYDQAGKLAYEFVSSADGSFNIKVEAGMRGSVTFVCEGYVMDAAQLSGQATNAIELAFRKVNIGGSITFADGTKVTTTSGGIIRSNEKGEVFDYVSSSSGRGQLVVQDAVRYSDNFVLQFTYERVAQPAGGAYSEDADASIGLRMYANGIDMEAMFIGNGYRVYHEGQFDGRAEKRGVSPVDMSLKTTPYPYNFKIIKSGDVLYMLAKTQSQLEYTLIYSFSISSWMGTDEVGYAIGWYSFGYNDMEIYDISLEEMTKENSSEIMSEVSLENNDGGTAVIEGGNNILIGQSYTIVATPDDGQRVESITINGQPVEFTTANGVVRVSATADKSDIAVVVTFGDQIYDVQVKVQRSNENAKYIKAVCGDTVKIFRVTRIESEMAEDTAYNDGENFNLKLPYGNGTWTITFWQDEACTANQIGGSVTVNVTKD